MDNQKSAIWIDAVRDSVQSYRKMIDATIGQLSDAEFFARPSPEVNSVAVILRHLGGNLQSRWTDFMTTDGEKPDRNRDAEFLDWDGDRNSLLEYVDSGWHALLIALDDIEKGDPAAEIFIRGESHSLALAVMRSVTHLSYHVGQIVMIARTVHDGEWQWLTIAPGKSAEHNQKTWGTAASRGATMDENSPDPL